MTLKYIFIYAIRAKSMSLSLLIKRYSYLTLILLSSPLSNHSQPLTSEKFIQDQRHGFLSH
ncbi:hypothetical protein FOFC_03813 [Fusarium oxysporum]|nr:hypothetical protein FOFC_03813 [Fusarium oxysporum]